MESRWGNEVATERATVGKRVGRFLYLHRSALDLAPKDVQDHIAATAGLVPDLNWNVVKVSQKELSLLVYEDFERSAFPALLASAKIDLSTGAVKKSLYDGREIRRSSIARKRFCVRMIPEFQLLVP